MTRRSARCSRAAARRLVHAVSTAARATVAVRMIEPLEERRMLATFTAGSGADTITLYTSAGVPHVVINGNDQATTDTSVRVNCGGGDDDIYMNDWAPNTVVDLGDGWNQVYYGGSSHVLFGTLPAATLIGGVNTDDVEFNDTGGGTTSRTYDFTPTSVLNQTMINDVDSIYLKTRPGNGGSPNSINITGSLVDYINTVNGTGTMNVGSSSAPVDMDAMDCWFTTDLAGDKNYYNQDADSSGQPFEFEVVQNVGGAQIQDMRKGLFRVSHYENYDDVGIPVNMTVFGGSTVDQFDIAGLVHASNVVLYGGGGNDICRTTNGLQSSHNDDIDDVFTGTLFGFFGGTGSDYFDLNDINDATNDGDGVYQLDSYQYLKNGVRYAYFDSSTERIQVIGDNSANDIYFTTNPGSSDTVAGAGGNDGLYAGTYASFSGYGGNTFVSGGDGIDGLYVNDNNAGGIIQYDFNGGNSFAWTNGGVVNGSFGYDSTLEQFNLTQNTGTTTTNVRQISPTLTLSIDANAGDDSFFVGNGDLDNNGFAHLWIAGGAGNDSVTFDDSLDAAVAGETETYTWTSVGLSKGPAVSIVCNPMENETLKVGSTNNALGTRNTVNLDSSNFSAVITNPTGNRLTTINVGGGNMNNIVGDINIAMPTGTVRPDILNINDQANANSNVQYQQLPHDFYRSVGSFITQFIHHTGIDQVNINAGAGNSAIVVGNSEPGTTTTYDGGGGNDTFYVGGGNLDANLLGDIIVVGGTGSDEVRFDNSAAAANDPITLNDGSLSDAATYYWSSVESVRIQTGPGGGTITVSALTTPAIVDGGAGPDVVNVGGGNIDGTLFATLTFNGGGGAGDALLIDDRFDGGNDSYNLSANQFSKYNGVASSPFVYWDGNVEGVTLQANGGDNFISVGSNIATRLNIFANAGNDNIYTNGSHDVTADTGPENGTGASGDTLTVNADGVAATVQLRGNDRVANLTVNGGGKLQLINATLDVTNPATMQMHGVIDMAGGALVVRNAAAQVAQYRTWIKAGRNGGAWNGTASGGAINSSFASLLPNDRAVGFAPASAIAGSFPTPFAGVSVNAADMLVRYTVVGDANLDRSVNLTDFTTLAANFNGTAKNWYQGDANYDDNVNLTDFTFLAGHFNQTLPSADAMLDVAPPPTGAAGAQTLWQATVEGTADAM